MLVHSGSRLLPAFPEALSREAERALLHLGVEVLLDRKVEAVGKEFVMVAGEITPTRTVLWAAGVMASPAAAWLGVDADRAGRVPVGADLSGTGSRQRLRNRRHRGVDGLGREGGAGPRSRGQAGRRLRRPRDPGEA